MTAIHSPMGKWGKDITLKGTGRVETTISHPELVKEEDGVLLIHVKEPIHEPLTLTHKGNDATVTVKVLTEANAEITIIEHISGEITHNLSAELAENSSVAYGLLQEGTYNGTKNAVLARDARMTWFELNEGTVKSRTETKVKEVAFVKSNSIYLGTEGDHIDFGSTAIHKEPRAASQLFTKGVLRSAEAVYDGILDIKKEAPHSEAHQRADCLLLDDKAEVKAAPQLFIDNNDVQCSHACSTTKPDEALAFYLQSRGVSGEVSNTMLVKAFVWPVIEALPQHLACWVEKHVEKKLEEFQ